jgi:hypothetical protein
MTSRALPIHRIWRSGHQAFGSRLMHPVAAGTGNPASGVAALNAPDMSRLIAMAAQACLVDSRRGQFRRVDDVAGGHRVDVGAGGAMTSFARMVFPAALLVGIDSFVGILLKRVEYVFMTCLAGVRANVGLWSGRGGRRAGSDRCRFRLRVWRRDGLLRPWTERILALAGSIRAGGQ